MKNEPLYTKRNRVRYGDRRMVGDTPVALIKTGKKSDFMTAEEIVEDIYQRPVDHIVFKDHEAS
ncbi:MAG: hypothetical protein IIT86_12500 [Oscillospiraceae bacterium]|jgi:hypothetical protein|nr:hypothetical protein [Oscillospiraceae bacterium]